MATDKKEMIQQLKFEIEMIGRGLPPLRSGSPPRPGDLPRLNHLPERQA